MTDQKSNCPHGIHYIADDCPGFTRKKRGRGFSYYDCDGKKISDKNIIKRIQSLVIPPMWQDVWICEDESGHLQVTGYDQKGRKQYIYHPKWTEYQQKNKFNRLKEFGFKLPDIRRQLERDIRKKGWPKQKILALIVMMLDEYYIRIGNKRYEQENKTYGLTTLRRKHINEKDGHLVISFKAKSGKEREIDIGSKKLIRLIKATSELPGYEIFRYLDDSKQSHRLDSHDVNEYLVEIAGEYFTAKDFRTWGGTMLALENYEESKKEVEENPRQKLETTIVKKVAAVLGNTVAVCREYYIHPKVMDVLLKNSLGHYTKKNLGKLEDEKELSEAEKLVLKII
ncbi:DNA topoisomerase IB [Fulvivirga maritima]|uniref:DNA topoisomerase IB n=1 Tax=Fulvivirga maritima TaxID=2904247 RepID=UPI001F1B2AF1|nr:DNA topoisomerase IB [Fulvivirga maritima]UII24771.1 DNA topoisomerase IB [Fulvivirga maritima]